MERGQVVIIAVVLAIAATGVLSGLLLGTFLIVVPLAWLVGLLGVGTRDYVNRARAAGHQLLREAGIPALWASLYSLPVWAITDWMVALLWWLLVVYIEIGRRSRIARQALHREGTRSPGRPQPVEPGGYRDLPRR